MLSFIYERNKERQDWFVCVCVFVMLISIYDCKVFLRMALHLECHFENKLD